jgi:hypothetical protein
MISFCCEITAASANVIASRIEDLCCEAYAFIRTKLPRADRRVGVGLPLAPALPRISHISH